ncbi:hypothetical protein G6F57_001115 [Rhizopus arrhizus]|uniref:Uncharacterized protein n=1 Tax=Rhizopus oryzae TaxID=64495 RepID=A0A9P6XGA2_RHIOR|nr:hypothetical protein G6F23_007628 [Rhizopus arrhizus]KAG1428801.1 hypothetical protein G6F58_000390 [Rhizopus delemar]KAG0767817.1 hypothetical protein G6F24_002459 [Rhizopus arrhizus]KAG0798024.1 hypothetical protein G6F21_000064 [Rhizopus arrhizus]KAG0802435.1 hypothetical protein G6F22_000257 [Rhizopus arrhizus]
MVQFLSLSSSAAVFFLLSLGVNNVAGAATNNCVVSASGSDDTSAITEAFKKCASGGTVTFSKGSTYNIKDTVTIEGLKNVNINFAGTLNLPARSSSFKNGDHYIQIKGENVNMYGGGTINGNGQAWYDAEDHTAPTVLRFALTDSKVSGIKIVNAPRAHLGVTNCENFVLDNITLKTASTSSKLAKNTDALDVSSSSGIVFQNSELTVGDDCLAINGGVTNITLSKITCNGGHGFSVGSLGKGGKSETVKTVRIRDSVCNNCQNGVRIKTWPGGKGAVSDVEYSNIKLNNVDNPILITTHYCDQNQQSYCNGNDGSSLSISDVTISDVTGSVSSAGNPVFSVNCSKNTPCTGFSVSGVDITKSSKTKSNVCTNLSGSDKISLCSSS